MTKFLGFPRVAALELSG